MWVYQPLKASAAVSPVVETAIKIVEFIVNVGKLLCR